MVKQQSGPRLARGKLTQYIDTRHAEELCARWRIGRATLVHNLSCVRRGCRVLQCCVFRWQRLPRYQFFLNSWRFLVGRHYHDDRRLWRHEVTPPSTPLPSSPRVLCSLARNVPVTVCRTPPISVGVCLFLKVWCCFRPRCTSPKLEVRTVSSNPYLMRFGGRSWQWRP